VRVLLLVVHAGLAAAWLGSMAYSLTVVQPRLPGYFGSDDDAHEAFVVALAHGNRWRVVSLVAALALSGVGLLLIDDGVDLAIHLVKGGLLAAAAALFWYVSWRHWPRRVFALPAERPALRGRLRLIAWTMLVLVGLAFALGVVAGA